MSKHVEWAYDAWPWKETIVPPTLLEHGSLPQEGSMRLPSLDTIQAQIPEAWQGATDWVQSAADTAAQTADPGIIDAIITFLTSGSLGSIGLTVGTILAVLFGLLRGWRTVRSLEVFRPIPDPPPAPTHKQKIWGKEP